MNIVIPDPIAEQAGLDEKSALKELALTLFAQGRLTAGQARRMAGVHFFEFEQWRTERGLPLREFTVEELESDIKTLRSLGLL
ncbi:MAG: UPF0175 family protein [Prosthecobacter sp.]|uniref:UPF0175 family protein n=1 Tax=Prosthecobacter sp. TaxID=1965333 RepID=UPI0038FE70D7